MAIILSKEDSEKISKLQKDLKPYEKLGWNYECVDAVIAFFNDKTNEYFDVNHNENILTLKLTKTKLSDARTMAKLACDIQKIINNLT